MWLSALPQIIFRRMEKRNPNRIREFLAKVLLRRLFGHKAKLMSSKPSIGAGRALIVINLDLFRAKFYRHNTSAVIVSRTSSCRSLDERPHVVICIWIVFV